MSDTYRKFNTKKNYSNFTTNSASNSGINSVINTANTANSTNTSNTKYSDFTKTTNNGSFTNYKSSYTKPNDSKDSKGSNSFHYNKQNYTNRKKNSTGDEIDEWIGAISSNNFDEIVNIFDTKKISWEDKIGDLLKKITREHKFEVLDYVLKHIHSFASNINKYKYNLFTLLNENVWIGKKNMIGESYDENIEFNKIIRTFDVLISNGFNFIDFSLLNNETLNKAEIYRMLSNQEYFYQSINKKNSKIPENLYNNINQYLFDKLNIKCPNEFLSLWESNPTIKSTIIKMVDDYYIESNLIVVRLKQTESFLGALINSKNKINPSQRDRLYDYFTKIYWDKEHFVSCLRIMFNKITESNSLLFIDNMQFILSRNVSIISEEIFKLVVSRESTNITERNIINSLFSDLVGREDLSMYFESINIGLIRETFLSNIIINYSKWIENIILIQLSSNKGVNPDEFRTNDYCVLMMIFGIAYSKGFKKNEILSVISIMLDRTDINLIKPLGVFLETSNISNVDLLEQEYQIIAKYINKYYFNKLYGFREKSIIETIMSKFSSSSKTEIKSHIDIRKEHIELFLTTGSFIKIMSKIKPDEKSDKKSSSKSSSKSTNKESTNKESSTESNSESTNKESTNKEPNSEYNSEYPELDEKVLNNINVYFKSNDKDSSFDDLKYYIEKSKIKLNNFVCGLLYSLGERTLSDISHIKGLIYKLNLISGFEQIIKKMDEYIKINPNLIEMLKCDNPKLTEIINELSSI